MSHGKSNSFEKIMLDEIAQAMHDFFQGNKGNLNYGIELIKIYDKEICFFKRGSTYHIRGSIDFSTLSSLISLISYGVGGIGFQLSPVVGLILMSATSGLANMAATYQTKKDKQQDSINKFISKLHAECEKHFCEEYTEVDIKSVHFSNFFRLRGSDKDTYRIVLYSTNSDKHNGYPFAFEIMSQLIDSYINVKLSLNPPSDEKTVPLMAVSNTRQLPINHNILYGAAQAIVTQYCGNDVSLDVLAKLSEMTYEKKTNAGVLIFTTNVHGKTISWTESVRLADLRQMRKLFETSRYGFGLVVDDNSTVTCLAHIEDEREAVQIKFFGTHGWKLYIGEQPILQFKNGNYSYPSDIKDISTALEVFNSTFRDEIENTACNMHAIENLLEQISELDHGAMAIFSSNASDEAERLCTLNRGIRLKKALLDPQDLKALSIIDGALLFDLQGYCYAFGVIVDGKAMVKGDSARGARYNSAANYIAWKNKKNNADKYVGVVHSDDGMVSVFPRQAYLNGEEIDLDKLY